MGEKRKQEIFGSIGVLCKSTLFFQGEATKRETRQISLKSLENKGKLHVENSVDNVDNNL